ncbi:MAG: HAD-IIIA family hydrolase [Dehalococcoidia bacterium]
MADLTKSSDGPISLLINRRVSLMLSGPLARAGVSPNAATVVSGLIGAGSAFAFAFQVWWLGGLLFQLASILGGVDGEIARRTGSSSRFGDFLDTMTDRAVEYGAFAGIAVGLTEAWDVWAWVVPMVALGGTFLLTSASEKYRSVMQRNYPKRQMEGLFAYLASGRDVRIFLIAVAAVVATFNVDVLLWSLVGMAAAMHLNFLYRASLIRRHMDDDSVQGPSHDARVAPKTRSGAGATGAALEVVFFDLGDTLWSFPHRPAEEEVFQESVRKITRLVGSWQDVPDGFAQGVAAGVLPALVEARANADAGDLRSPDSVSITRQVASSLGMELGQQRAEQLWLAWNVGGPFLGRRIFPDTFEALDWLRERGYRLGAITNRELGGQAFLDELRHNRLAEYFEVVAVSVDVGWRKPHPAVFEHALEAMNVTPERSVMVGDQPTADIEGAKRLGMTAVWKRNGDLAYRGRFAPDFVIDHPRDLVALPLFR